MIPQEIKDEVDRIVRTKAELRDIVVRRLKGATDTRGDELRLEREVTICLEMLFDRAKALVEAEEDAERIANQTGKNTGGW
jgi:hypothetical protein